MADLIWPTCPSRPGSRRLRPCAVKLWNRHVCRRGAISIPVAEWSYCRRYRRGLSLVMLDVDLFKDYNDTLGHPEGDRMLKAVADLLRASVRETDFVARYGGDEFVVLLREADADAASTAAHRF